MPDHALSSSHKSNFQKNIRLGEINTPMKNLILICSGIVVAFFLFIPQAFSQHDSLVIQAKVTGFPDGIMFFLENKRTQEILDSALLSEGKFDLRSQLENSPEILFLFTRVDGVKKYTWMMLGNEKVTLNADINDFPWTIDVSGSSYQDERESYLEYIHDWQKKADKWTQKMAGGKFKMAWVKKFKTAKDSMFSRGWSYIQKHPNSPHSLYVLNGMLEKLEKEDVASLFNRVPSAFQTGSFGKPIATYLDYGFLTKGDTIFDFETENEEGKIQKLSSVSDQYTLLVFMSSGCGISNASNEGLKALQEAQDSIQIASFYVDGKREKWLRAHHSLGGDWTSFWDGEGVSSEVYIRYGATAFPSFVLIDPEGEIIKMWSGYSISGDKEYIIKKIRSSN